MLIIILLSTYLELQHQYQKWCKLNNFQLRLSKDFKQHKDNVESSHQTSLFNHFQQSKALIILYSAKVFEVSTIEWLVHTNQVGPCCLHSQIDLTHCYEYAKDDRWPMTYWLSRGRLRIVLVFSQEYQVWVSDSSSGTNTLATVLGTESGRILTVFKKDA